MSATVEQIARKGVYDGDFSAAELQQLIAAVREVDQSSEGWQKAGCFSLVLGIPLLFPTSMVLLDVNPVLGVGAVVAGLTLLIGGIVLRIRFGRTNFENRRYELASSLGRLLTTDMAPDAKFSLKMNLLPENHKSKFTHKGTVGRWTVKYFDDPWLQLGGRLLDGTHFQINMLEKHQARRCTKRSASGKTKVKTKSKNAAQAQVSLKTKSGRYPSPDQLRDLAMGAVQIPPWALTRSLAVEGNSLSLKTMSKQRWDVALTGKKTPDRDGVQLVATMLLSLYQILNLARQIDKAQDSSE